MNNSQSIKWEIRINRRSTQLQGQQSVANSGTAYVGRMLISILKILAQLACYSTRTGLVDIIEASGLGLNTQIRVILKRLQKFHLQIETHKLHRSDP
jgi:hypothetical protein